MPRGGVPSAAEPQSPPQGPRLSPSVSGSWVPVSEVGAASSSAGTWTRTRL